jgi:hypothetical protein
MDTIKFVKFVDSAGQKRTGVEKQCPVCGKQFITRTDQPHNTCSGACRGKLKRNRVDITCAWCGKLAEKKKSKLRSKSGIYFCSRKCKDEAQKLGGIQAIMPPHFGTGTGEYRKLFAENELYCRRCGYKEFTCGVDVHHIDENRKNMDKDNLVPLCAPCHRALHWGLWKL